MPTPSDTCPKCQGKMCDGFVATEDVASAVAYVTSAWHPGKVIQSVWTRVKVRRAELQRITANRCEQCGFLELYAR